MTPDPVPPAGGNWSADFVSRDQNHVTHCRNIFDKFTTRDFTRVQLDRARVSPLNFTSQPFPTSPTPPSLPCQLHPKSSSIKLDPLCTSSGALSKFNFSIFLQRQRVGCATPAICFFFFFPLFSSAASLGPVELLDLGHVYL